MNRLFIKGGRVVDPANGIDGIFDVYCVDGKIVEITHHASRITHNDCTVIDATGLHVFPGFIDMHTHLREPGYEYKEDIRTGTMAAAAGGGASSAKAIVIDGLEAAAQDFLKVGGELFNK